MNLFKFERLFIIEKLTSEPTMAKEAKIQYDLSFVQRDEFPSVAHKFKGFDVDINGLFKDGYFCAMAEIDGNLIHWSFIALDKAYILEIEKTIHINSNLAYQYAGFTAPEFRGLRIATTVLETYLKFLHKKGIKKMLSVLRTNNIPSLKYVTNVGCRIIGKITFLKIGPLKYYRYKGISKEDHDTLTMMFK